MSAPTQSEEPVATQEEATPVVLGNEIFFLIFFSFQKQSGK